MRSFLAYPIPENIQEEISRLLHGLPNTSWIKLGNFHITLQFYPNFPEDSIDLLYEKLEKVQFLSIFTRARGLGKFSHPKGNSVIWLGLENEMEMIQERNKLCSCLKDLKLEFDKKFLPHITLGRSKNLPENRWISYFENFQFFESTEFQLNSIVLYKSNLSPKGSIYEEIFRISF